MNSDVTISGNTLISTNNEGIQFDNNNTGIVIANNNISSDNEAIEFDNDNQGRITGNTISNDIGEAIDLSNDNVFAVSGNTFNNVGDDAIRIGSDNTVSIDNNLFAGLIGGQLLDVDGAGANLLSGAGNISNVAITCQSGTFAGTVEISGTILQDGVAPCN